MKQFLNTTLDQIRTCDCVGSIRGTLGHLRWQLRKLLGLFPCELTIGDCRIRVDRPGGVAALVNTMGEYDYNDMEFLQLALSQKPSTFADVGANVDSYMVIPSEVPETKAAVPRQVPVKVAFLTNCIPPYFLPVLRSFSKLLQGLRVFVSTPMEPDRPWEPEWADLEVTVQKSMIRVCRQVYKQGFSMTFFRHFPYDSLPLLYRYKPDVVISAQLGFRTMQSIAYRLLNPKSRLIFWVDVSERSESGVGYVQTRIRKFMVLFADAVIVNGASGIRYVESLGVSTSQIVPAPYASGLTELTAIPLGRSPTVARRILYVVRLIYLKGLEIFFQELARWANLHRDAFCEVWLVGDGPLRQTLERFSMPSNIELHFTGNVNYSELPRYYAQAGIFVLPCLADTWGLVVNEALAGGLPVLGSLHSQAVEELVRDGVNGWTFYPDRPEQLRNALDAALSLPVCALTRMREDARKSVQHLNADYSAERFLRAIKLAMET